MNIGKSIKNIRKMKKLTQKQCAENFYLSQSHLSEIEKGKHLPSTRTILNLCKFLKVSPARLYIGAFEIDDYDNKKQYSEIKKIFF